LGGANLIITMYVQIMMAILTGHLLRRVKYLHTELTDEVHLRHSSMHEVPAPQGGLRNR